MNMQEEFGSYLCFLYSENVWEVSIFIYKVGSGVVLVSQICFGVLNSNIEADFM